MSERITELEQLVEQLQAENEELKRSRGETESLHREFADLYEYAPVGYLLLNSRYIIVKANQTALELLGAPKMKLGTIGLGTLIDKQCHQAYFRAIRESQTGEKPARAEVCVAPREGDRSWILLRVIHAPPAEEAEQSEEADTRYRITLTDITERVAAQEKAEARSREVEKLLKEKEMLLRELNHRVKNDFAMINSFLALQADETEYEEVRESINEARSRVSVMAKVYRALQVQDDYESVALNPILQTIVDGFAARLRSDSIAVTTNLSSLRASSQVCLSLGLILNELLTNVVKYAFTDMVEGAVSVDLEPVGSEELLLTVTDSGRGFDVNTAKGGGLGLSVVQALAAQHKGTVDIDTSDGTVVSIRMRTE